VAGVSVRVAAPVEVVFDYLCDPRNRPAWQRGLRRVELVDGGPPRLGMRWVDVTWAGARPELAITRFDPGQVWAERGSWRGLEAWLALRFAPVAAATVVSADVRVLGRPAWAAPAAALGLLAPSAVAADLRLAGRLLARSRS
jgi:uncharacterized protein YndB with AHSA1/START domain